MVLALSRRLVSLADPTARGQCDMNIPVFVSCPTALNAAQNASRNIIIRELERHNLEWRALGRSDYPTELPLREVHLLAKHCAGGVILGFEQFRAPSGVWKHGVKSNPKTGEKGERRVTDVVRFPTPWNHLEAGILFSLGLPLLVFAEPGITGGVFDPGVTDVFVHPMPSPRMSKFSSRGLGAVFQKWQASVRAQYYR